MDAISFVLGVRSSHLRSEKLKDMVYRGRIIQEARINADGTVTEADGDAGGDANGNSNGDSQEKQYGEALEEHSILVKARNFLVFQGDVEKLATTAPEQLTLQVERISGSLEQKAEYDRLKEESEAATEDNAKHLH